jgi:RNA polymerase sigma-70 factor, ECF subfamily
LGGRGHLGSVQQTVGLRLAQQDTTDLEGLFQTHAQSVARWALRLGGADIDPADIVQEVYLVARKRRLDPKDPGVVTWLYRTTRNLVRSVRRRQRWRRWLHLDAGGEDEIPSGVIGPAEAVMRNERVRLLNELLGRLPNRHGEAVILFELEGHSTHEIATLMGAPVQTVRVWLHRGRSRLLELAEQLPEAQRDVLEFRGEVP